MGIGGFLKRNKEDGNKAGGKKGKDQPKASAAREDEDEDEVMEELSRGVEDTAAEDDGEASSDDDSDSEDEESADGKEDDSGPDHLMDLFYEDEGANDDIRQLAMSLEELDIYELAEECTLIADELRNMFGPKDS